MAANKNGLRPEDDFYETPEDVTLSMLAHLDIPEDIYLYEPACGNGAIAKILPGQHRVLATELQEGRYGVGGMNFLELKESIFPPDARFWVITNPPYKEAADFVRKSFELGAEKVIMFLRYNFGEGSKYRNDILDDGRLALNLLYKERITMYPANYVGVKKEHRQRPTLGSYGIGNHKMSQALGQPKEFQDMIGEKKMENFNDEKNDAASLPCDKPAKTKFRLGDKITVNLGGADLELECTSIHEDKRGDSEISYNYAFTGYGLYLSYSREEKINVE